MVLSLEFRSALILGILYLFFGGVPYVFRRHRRHTLRPPRRTSHRTRREYHSHSKNAIASASRFLLENEEGMAECPGCVYV
jgi:hypothetical protein